MVVGPYSFTALRACQYFLGAWNAPPSDWFVKAFFHQILICSCFYGKRAWRAVCAATSWICIPDFKPSLVENWIRVYNQ